MGVHYQVCIIMRVLLLVCQCLTIIITKNTFVHKLIIVSVCCPFSTKKDMVVHVQKS